MEKHFIDNSIFLELVTELASENTKLHFREKTITDWNGTNIVYTEEAQDFFNEAYIDVEKALNNAGIYSNINLEYHNN